MPVHTSISEIIPFIPKSSLSSRSSPESITPKRGLKNPNMATFETGLFFKRSDHTEYAAPDTNARYKIAA